jgi:hypothetical protein
LSLIDEDESLIQLTAKSKDEPPSDELTHVIGRRLDSSSNQDKDTANKDTDSTPVSVCEKSTKGKGGDLTTIVDDEYNAG